MSMRGADSVVYMCIRMLTEAHVCHLGLWRHPGGGANEGNVRKDHVFLEKSYWASLKEGHLLFTQSTQAGGSR